MHNEDYIRRLKLFDQFIWNNVECVACPLDGKCEDRKGTCAHIIAEEIIKSGLFEDDYNPEEYTKCFDEFGDSNDD